MIEVKKVEIITMSLDIYTAETFKEALESIGEIDDPKLSQIIDKVIEELDNVGV